MALPKLKIKRVLPQTNNYNRIEVIEVPKTISGPSGPPGVPGRDGIQGLSGLAPEHEVKNGEIRFKNPDGTWGKWISFNRGPGGANQIVNYKKLNLDDDYTINGSELVWGLNIFGVTASTALTVYLPTRIEDQQIIVIKDEGGNAGTNNITIAGQ